MTRADQIDAYGIATVTHEADDYTATLEVDWADEWCEHDWPYRDDEQVFTPDLETARVTLVTSPDGSRIYGGCWHDRAKREWLESAGDAALVEQVFDAAGLGHGRDEWDYEEPDYD